MEISLWTVAMPIGLTVLCILLTGPGMWSEKWGWNLLDRKKRREPEEKR